MKRTKERLQKVPARFDSDFLSGRKHILPLRECRIRFKCEGKMSKHGGVFIGNVGPLGSFLVPQAINLSRTTHTH